MARTKKARKGTRSGTGAEKRTRTRRPWGGSVFLRPGRGDVYYARYRDSQGRTRTVSTGETDRTEAERELARLTGQVAADVERGVRAVDLATFADDAYFRVVESRQRSKTSTHAKEVRRHLTEAAEFFGKRPMHSITRDDATKYVSALRGPGRGASAGTVRRIASALSQTWRDAIQANAAIENVWRQVRLPKLTDHEAVVLQPQQLSKLYAHVPPQIAALVVVLGETGGRLGETMALQWSQVAADASSVTFTNTKSGKARRVPLTSVARELLTERRAARVAPLTGPDLVFAGCPTSKSYVLQLFRRGLKSAGLDERMRLHDLRHTYGAGLAMAGVPLSVIGKLLGHASLKMTMRYSRWVPDGEDARAVAALELSRAAPATAAQAQAG